VSTIDRYAIPAGELGWNIPASGSARFSWDYEDGRDRLLSLYEKGKDKQWNAATRIDWSQDVDPFNPLGFPDERLSIYGTPTWEKLSQKNRDELRQHQAAFNWSQFLHGEQGALICSARIVESVPDIDAKFYAATQTIDEARHAELFARFLNEKIGVLYPITPALRSMIDSTLNDSRWDMPFLGMQVLIEGLALASFGSMRDFAGSTLAKQILAYVMQDEARHVAFGRYALRDYYRQLTDAERSEREDFVVEACWLMRDRLRGAEVWDNLGFDVAEAMVAVESSDHMRLYRRMLFSRIVPCIKDIGLWGEKVIGTYEQMGVLDMADVDLTAMGRADEEAAEAFDTAQAGIAARRQQVAETIAAAD